MGSQRWPLTKRADHLGLGDLEFIALAAHVLDQDGELQRAAPFQQEGLLGIGVLQPQAGVVQDLAAQAVVQLGGGDEAPFLAGEGGIVDREGHGQGRLVDVHGRQRQRLVDVGHRLAQVDVLDAGQRHDVAGDRLGDADPADAVVGEDAADLVGLALAVALDQQDVLPLADGAVVDAAGADLAEVVVVADRRGHELERADAVAVGLLDVAQDGLEEGLQVPVLVVQLVAGDPLLGRRVEHREIELLVVGAQLDEQVEDRVQHLVGAGVRAVDLVDDHDRAQPLLQRFLQHVLGLGHGPLEGVDQQQHRVDHLHDALHLAAEIGVARRVDDVDLVALVLEGGVLGKNGDAALPFQVVGVHHPLADVLVVAEHARLPEHGVDQRGLAVVDMGDDGDILKFFHMYFLCLHFRRKGIALVGFSDWIRNPNGRSRSVIIILYSSGVVNRFESQ